MAGDRHDAALAKNENAFPDFDPLLAYFMAKETDQFLRKTLFENNGTFEDMLLADHAYVNGPLAAFYGAAGPERIADKWIARQLDHQQARGPADAGSLLATMAKEDRTEPGAPREVRAPADPVPRSVIRRRRRSWRCSSRWISSKTAREQFQVHAESDVCAWSTVSSIRWACR